MINLDKTGKYIAFVDAMENDEQLRNVTLERDENFELTDECVQTIAQLIVKNLDKIDNEQG